MSEQATTAVAEAPQQEAATAPQNEVFPLDAQLIADQRLCRMYFASKLFADIKDMPPEQAIAAAMVKVHLGRVIGVSDILAMQDITIIKGRPSIGAAIRGERMKAYGYTWRFTKHTDAECALDLYCQGVMVGSSSFTIEQARKAGLVSGGSAWEKYPRNMLFARALTNAQRFHAPEVLGGIPMLDPSEAEELVNVNEDQTRRIAMPQRRTESLPPPVEAVDTTADAQPEATAASEAPETPRITLSPGELNIIKALADEQLLSAAQLARNWKGSKKELLEAAREFNNKQAAAKQPEQGELIK